jgi:hypothetical protein
MKMKTVIRWIVAVACLGVHVALHAAAAPKPEPGLHVHIVMFSGREDPKFVITDPKEIAELLGGIRALPAHPSLRGDAALPLPMFGFRGVMLANHSNQHGEVTLVHVYRNAVEVVEKAAGSPAIARNIRVESSGTLEARLVSMAKARGVFPKN